MRINLASLLRTIALDMTSVGEAFTKAIKDLEKNIPEIKHGLVKDPARKSEVVDMIAKALLDVVEKVEGHGLAGDKAAEVRSVIKNLQNRNDLKGLISYPYMFAMAWKHKVYADMMVICSNCKESFDWGGRSEIAMGAVACPKCGKAVDQKGNAV
jgi:DNA-directed RNA polymerase subunit RPC12/RpoP